MSKNMTLEMHDDNVASENTPMTQEEILMKEGDILRELLELEKEKENEANYRTIRIKRGGKTKLTFRVRPITEDESRACLKQATPTARNKNSNVEPDLVKFRSLVIYTATVAEDRVKIWDNREAKMRMNVIEGWQIVDKVVFAGEKSRIMDIIDEISYFDADFEDKAGN